MVVEVGVVAIQKKTVMEQSTVCDSMKTERVVVVAVGLS
jgi:hypothetical protein